MVQSISLSSPHQRLLGTKASDDADDADDVDDTDTTGDSTSQDYSRYVFPRRVSRPVERLLRLAGEDGVEAALASDPRTAYRVLHTSSFASLPTIKKKYRSLSVLLHPGKGNI